MNILTLNDKRKLNAAFNENGYVPKIASSDLNLEKIFNDLEIDILKYRSVNGSWLSKGKTMTVFWDLGSDQEIYKFLFSLKEKLISENEISVFSNNRLDNSKEIKLINEILGKFNGNPIEVLVTKETVTKEKLMPYINESMKKGEYLLALDKIHTLLVHILKDKIGFLLTNDRNTLSFMLNKYIENTDLSVIEKIKLTNDKELSSILNDARNNKSLAHDNEGNYMKEEDAKILCENFIQTINLISR